MALGLSGQVDLVNRPLEVSYFINNVCNLACRHCYVGYEQTDGGLPIREWTETFDKLIEMSALTFGNVGKEPLLSPDKTVALLRHLASRRDENPRLRFGLVTNGTLLHGRVLEEIAAIDPGYLDVSLDGTQREHDYIRGEGNYERTVENLRGLPSSLVERVFVSFTLMRHNQGALADLVEEMGSLGFSKFLVSPYVATPGSRDELGLAEEGVVEFYSGIVSGEGIDFSRLGRTEVILKSDYDAQKGLMDKLVERGVIDVRNLRMDEYGVVFNEYTQEGSSKVFVNYIPVPETFSRAVRISHDGYVSGCLEMFHTDYPERARGNLREARIEALLAS
ncbi:MAG: radical SAM protein [Nanoarchaeota archaeon]|nr:radical SAM protein [Nanoarchaeota archaeon]MBU1051865.1 radical SAM protein [Nanoarchaeota archaeon]MBU1988999.1 radical SAM protein [Nanoarchaeota archaeon]